MRLGIMAIIGSSFFFMSLGCGNLIGGGSDAFVDGSRSDTPGSDTSSSDSASSDTSNNDTGPADTPAEDTGNSGQGETGAMMGMTAAHNAVRDTVGIPNIVWDEDIAAFADEWAGELQRRGCDLDHRPRSGEFEQQYGENIAWFGGQSGSAQEVVDMWASEVADYDYGSNSCTDVCGHYTQIVWADSVRLGCAMRDCGGSTVWVCNYDPPGNYVGERPY